jgi:hypothetical protein
VRNEISMTRSSKNVRREQPRTRTGTVPVAGVVCVTRTWKIDERAALCALGMRANDTAHLLLASHSVVGAEALALAPEADLRIGEAPDTPATGQLRVPADALARLHQFAAELNAPMPMLEQAPRHLDRCDAGRTDELVVAYYRQLTAGSASKARPRPKQEHS